jgi:hypothetical protein
MTNYIYGYYRSISELVVLTATTCITILQLNAQRSETRTFQWAVIFRWTSTTDEPQSCSSAVEVQDIVLFACTYLSTTRYITPSSTQRLLAFRII